MRILVSKFEFLQHSHILVFWYKILELNWRNVTFSLAISNSRTALSPKQVYAKVLWETIFGTACIFRLKCYGNTRNTCMQQPLAFWNEANNILSKWLKWVDSWYFYYWKKNINKKAKWTSPLFPLHEAGDLRTLRA